MNFATRWTMGSILGLKSDERIDRWALTLNLSNRADHDPEFRNALLQNPRYLAAIAIQESCGIKPIDFLWQVNTVSILEEVPGLHWLILPACHRGCITTEAKELPTSVGSCAVCGRPQGQSINCQQTTSSSTTQLDLIHQVDEHIARTVSANQSEYERMIANPTNFFIQATQSLFGVLPHEKFGINEVKVAADTDTSLYLVLLTNHKTMSLSTHDNLQTVSV
jgi:hypothetical protein